MTITATGLTKAAAAAASGSIVAVSHIKHPTTDTPVRSSAGCAGRRMGILPRPKAHVHGFQARGADHTRRTDEDVRRRPRTSSHGHGQPPCRTRVLWLRGGPTVTRGRTFRDSEGTVVAARQLGDRRQLAAGYLAAEYGDWQARPSWTKAAAAVVLYYVLLSWLSAAGSSAFRAGILTDQPRATGTFSWYGIPYLLDNVNWPSLAAPLRPCACSPSGGLTRVRPSPDARLAPNSHPRQLETS